MSWVIVKFLEEDSVEVVPSNWISTDDSCFWPPPTFDKLDSAIKDCVEVNKNSWSIYKIKMLSRRPYDKFHQASAKASKACITSDLSETDSLPNKRIVKKKIFSDSSTDDSDSENVYNLPKFPEAPIKPGQSAIRKGLSSQLKKGQPLPATNDDRTNISIRQPLPATNDDRTNVSIINKFQEEMLQQIIKIKATLVEQEKAMKEHNRILSDLSNKLDQQWITSIGEAKQDLANDLLGDLPLKTEEDVRKMEENLKNQEAAALLTKNLAKLGGINFKENIRRILTKIFTNNLASNYSYQGRKGKKALINLRINKIILDAVQLYDKEPSLKSIEITVSVWLTKAGDRIKRQKMDDEAVVEAVEDD